MAEQYICVGDIYHPQGQEGLGPMPMFPAGSVFPMDELRARVPEAAAANARRRGIDLNAPGNEELKARFEASALADFEHDMQELIDTGSLKLPGEVLPSATLAQQLAQKEAELELLRQQLAEQGVAPSLLPGAAKRGKAQPVAASEDGASASGAE